MRFSRNLFIAPKMHTPTAPWHFFFFTKIVQCHIAISDNVECNAMQLSKITIVCPMPIDGGAMLR